MPPGHACGKVVRAERARVGHPQIGSSAETMPSARRPAAWAATSRNAAGWPRWNRQRASLSGLYPAAFLSSPFGSEFRLLLLLPIPIGRPKPAVEPRVSSRRRAQGG